MKFTVARYIMNMFKVMINLALRACKRLPDALVVLAAGACLLLMQPALLLHASRLAEEAQAWRDSGPHHSLLGRVRARLAAAGLLAAPRDPLAECGVPVGEGWRHFLRLVFLPKRSLACVEWQVHLAWEEHQAFTAALLLALACIGLLVLLALCLLSRRRHQPPEGTRGDPHPGEGGGAEEEEDVPPPDAAGEKVFPGVEEVGAHPPPDAEGRDILPEVEEVEAAPPPDAEGGEVLPEVKEVGAHPPPDAEGREILPKVEEVEADFPPDAEGGRVLLEVEEVGAASPPLEAGEYGSPEAEGQGNLPQQETSPGGETSPQTPVDPGREGVGHEWRREVRHSLHVPPCLRERLAGPQECFLEYLRRRHSVLIFMDAARKRMHVKGAKEDVVACCGAVRAMLAEWRRRHAASEE